MPGLPLNGTAQRPCENGVSRCGTAGQCRLAQTRQPAQTNEGAEKRTTLGKPSGEEEGSFFAEAFSGGSAREAQEK